MEGMAKDDSLRQTDLAGDRTVRVSLPVSVAYDIDKIQKVQRSILDRLGCMACCSGWDIRFDVHRDFLVDERLEVREVGF